MLIIEDDTAIAESLTRALTHRGHEVTHADTGAGGLAQARDTDPEMILLDLGLPDIDGLEVLTRMRQVSQTPVVVVTARDDDESVVRALDGGADDYVVKPFTTGQLEARLRAVLRRVAGSSSEPVLRAGGVVIDTVARRATKDDVELDLSRREFDLLAYLVSRQGEVVTKREILGDVWHQPYGGADRTVDVHLSWLRRKLGETAADPAYLHSVRGVGVRFEAPAEA